MSNRQFFTAHFWISTQMVYLQSCLVLTWLVPRETAAVLAHFMFTIQPCTSHHSMQNHISKVHACLAVTCHLHFWQNNWNLLHATVVTQEWNRYQNTSQQLKKKKKKEKEGQTWWRMTCSAFPVTVARRETPLTHSLHAIQWLRIYLILGDVHHISENCDSVATLLSATGYSFVTWSGHRNGLS